MQASAARCAGNRSVPARRFKIFRRKAGTARLNDWDRSPDARYVSGAADHFHRCADPHPAKKFGRHVSRHPNTTVRRRVAG